MLRLFLSKLKLLRRVTNWCNCLENYQLLLLWIVLSPDLRISWTNLSCSAPASVRSPCRACSCCAACCCWWGRGWRGPRCPPSCPPPLPGRRTEGKTGSWNTFYWQPAEIKSEFFIFKKTDCKRGVLNVEKNSILTFAWAAVESENWSDMDMDDMEEGGNMAPAWTRSVKWSIVEYYSFIF